MLGLNGEAGEVAEKLKKIIRDKNSVVSEEDKQEMAKELATSYGIWLYLPMTLVYRSMISRLLTWLNSKAVRIAACSAVAATIDDLDPAQPYLAACVILRQHDKIAFVLRSNTSWMNGFYGLPGGKVEIGEAASTAAIREAKEEVGVTIAPENLRQVLMCHRQADDDTSSWIDIIFEADTWQGEVVNAEPDHHSELAWFDWNELPENTVPITAFVLAKIAAGHQYAEFGWETSNQAQNMDMDVEALVRDYLPNVIHMSLATAHDNLPWVCELHYAFDDELNIYWRSLTSRRHSQEIAQNPRVAGTIVKQHRVDEDPFGVYFEGTAEVLAAGPEQHHAYETIKGRLQVPDTIFDEAQSPDGHQFYKLTVTTFYVFGIYDHKGQKLELRWNGNSHE